MMSPGSLAIPLLPLVYTFTAALENIWHYLFTQFIPPLGCKSLGCVSQGPAQCLAPNSCSHNIYRMKKYFLSFMSHVILSNDKNNN